MEHEEIFFFFKMKFQTQPMAGSEEQVDPFSEKMWTSTLLYHSIERTVKDFTLRSPPFSVIAPLCVGGGGGRSHYNRCFMTGPFHFDFSAEKKKDLLMLVIFYSEPKTKSNLTHSQIHNYMFFCFFFKMSSLLHCYLM